MTPSYCEIHGHDWSHVPLSDYIDYRICGEIKYPKEINNDS